MFKKENSVNGGVFGTVIGVKNIEESLVVYRDILGFNETVYDETGVFDDFVEIPGGKQEFRRILLRHTDVKNGAFQYALWKI